MIRKDKLLKQGGRSEQAADSYIGAFCFVKFVKSIDCLSLSCL